MSCLLLNNLENLFAQAVERKIFEDFPGHDPPPGGNKVDDLSGGAGHFVGERVGLVVNDHLSVRTGREGGGVDRAVGVRCDGVDAEHLEIVCQRDLVVAIDERGEILFHNIHLSVKKLITPPGKGVGATPARRNGINAAGDAGDIPMEQKRALPMRICTTPFYAGNSLPGGRSRP